jgi:hypothetical protein
LLKLDLYASVSLQYSRGCPYRCEFCDIIVMFGRRPRVKSLEQVGRELDALRALGMKRVFFVDDNLIGNRPQAKLLLGYLADYQRQHRYAFSFGTEASLNLAQDKELLGLFRAANFGWVFIGIESPDEDSLKETKKTQNTGQDILASVRKVYAYGIDVLAGFIVGFDHDTVDTFERQYRFIMESGIQAAMVGLLHAAPRTPLYERIKKEGRLLDEGDSCDNTRAATNIQPKNMALTTMVERYEQLYRRLVSDRAVAQRIRNKTRYLRAPSYVGGFSTRDSWLIAWRLLVRGILPGGPRRIVSFLRSLPWLAPRSFSLVLADWITGLSMAEFVRRHFSAEEQPSRTLEDRLGAIRRAFAHYLEAGKVSLSVGSGPAPELAIVLKDLLDGGFFQSAAPRLDRLLEHTRASLTLRIEAFHEHQRAHFDRLLRRLARHGDRIRIEVDETLRALVPIDSSVFNLALPGGNG